MTADCPSLETLADFQSGQLDGETFDRVAAHVAAECPRCVAALAGLERQANPLADSLRRPRIPTEAGTLLAERYELVEVLGQGGMGTVWRARQVAPLQREVAIKLIRPGLDSAGVLARFDTERQALALMDHPNIAKVFDAGSTADGRPFFVMELVPGATITKYCDEHRLPLRDRLALFVQVCQAVQHAHQKGIIHRDLKPGNVLVASYGGRPVPKVIDFGVAKAAGPALTDRTLQTGLGDVVGTLEYMAPEQAEVNQLDVDTRADVYSLGVILYELLTGGPPLDRVRLRSAALLEMLRMVREDEPAAPSTRLSTSDALPSIAASRSTEPRRLANALRGDLDWIVLKALEKDRNRRYATANGFAADIGRYLADEPVEAARPGRLYRLRKFARKHRRGLTVATAMAVILIGAAVFSGWQAVVAIRERDNKQQALDRLEMEEQKTQAALARSRQELADRESVQDFYLQTVVAAGRPKGARGGLGIGVTLRSAIDAAVPRVAAAFLGRPLVESAIRMGLGDTYHSLGDPKAAAEQYEKAKALREAALGPTHRDVLAADLGIARAWISGGRAADAVTRLEQVIAAAKVNLPADDPDLLRARSGLATAYNALDRFRDAADEIEAILPDFQERFGPDHADTLIAMSKLAEGLACDFRHPEAAARRERAIELLETIRAMRLATIGPMNPDTLIVSGNLASALITANRDSEALTILEAVAPAREAVFGADHPDTLIGYTSLAVVYLRKGMAHEAIGPFERVLAVYRTSLPLNEANVLNLRMNLAQAYSLDRRHSDAVAELDDVLRHLRKPPFGVDHPRTLQAQAALARAHLNGGRPEAAKPHFDDYLARQRRILGAKDLRFAEALALTGRDLVNGLEFTEAVPPLREALAIYETKQPESWARYAAQAMLAIALLEVNGDEAVPLAEAAFTGLKKHAAAIPENQRAPLTQTVNALIRFHLKSGAAEAVARWQAERSAFPRERAPRPRPAANSLQK